MLVDHKRLVTGQLFVRHVEGQAAHKRAAQEIAKRLEADPEDPGACFEVIVCFAPGARIPLVQCNLLGSQCRTMWEVEDRLFLKELTERELGRIANDLME